MALIYNLKYSNMQQFYAAE